VLRKINHLAHNLPVPRDPFLDKRIEEYYKHVSANLNYYKFLYGLVQLYEPKLVLEIGVEFGLASAHMASAAKKYGGHVVGVDHKYHHVPGRMIGEAYGNYDFIQGDSRALLTISRVAEFVESYGPIDLVFQDSSHHYVESIEEWEAYTPLLGEKAIWVCDDISPPFHDPNIDPPDKGMVQYFEGLPGEKMLLSVCRCPGNALGVVLL
jgi:predicted O-methyltransferase YrrM